jgi:tetratricopeptide (TPR) repeat protein
MDQQLFNLLFKSTTPATAEVLAQIQALAEKHPYSSFIYIQLAKKSKQVLGDDAEQIIAKAAIRARSRAWLKTALETPATPLESMKIPDFFPISEVEAQTAKREAQEFVPRQITKTDKPEVLNEIAKVEPKPIGEPEHINVEHHNTAESKKGFVFRLVEQPLAKAKRSTAKNTAEPQTKTKKSVKAPAKKDDNKPSPANKEVKAPPAEPTLFEDMSAESTKLKRTPVTENMAYIYMKQKNYDKAIQIYKKLMLKFPEKRDYFAALIQGIEKNIN